MIFDSWIGLGRILVVGILAYAALIILLRISGKRTLTKLNAFDLVITVALGSTLSTVLLTDSVSLSEGVLAMAVLIFLQFAITWLSMRSGQFKHIVKSEPTLILHQGTFLDEAMTRERVTREEVLAVLRSNGIAETEAVSAVILETNGTMSVVSAIGTAADILP